MVFGCRFCNPAPPFSGDCVQAPLRWKMGDVLQAVTAGLIKSTVVLLRCCCAARSLLILTALASSSLLFYVWARGNFTDFRVPGHFCLSCFSLKCLLLIILCSGSKHSAAFSVVVFPGVVSSCGSRSPALPCVCLIMMHLC